jgi:hypothetical protein|tara:strand:- start:32 stop:430 length:399 start_codon:yes stop_codon:yes gene_type:complete
MYFKNRYTCLAVVCISLLLSTCTISPERQAKLDEFDNTIPRCSSDFDCGPKWLAARAWVIENSDFGIRAESDDRIMATSNIISNSGLGVVVDRVLAANGYQIVVDLECFSSYGCPNILDSKIDFNRTLNAVR